MTYTISMGLAWGDIQVQLVIFGNYFCDFLPRAYSALCTRLTIGRRSNKYFVILTNTHLKIAQNYHIVVLAHPTIQNQKG